jgi:transposase-like protein
MWPIELRERCTQRLLQVNPPSIQELSVETGVPHGTLWRWRQAVCSPVVPCDVVDMSKRSDRRPRDWPPAERLRVINESASLSDEELGEFLRREGLHANTLAAWREDALVGLGAPSRATTDKRVSRRERALQRELRRKEKALAETAALLVLQKKARDLFGDDEDDSSSDT